MSSALPPGPSEPAAVQTARWLARPVAFLESCRRRYGDAFSVRFLGFAQPMVMLSHPEAIRALYSEREHGLPPGRTVTLRPILGPRSVLLLEGREHLERRKLMLPPFHGERMQAYEQTVREIAEHEIDRWPRDEPFAVHPSMQAITLEVIMRAVFGITDARRRARLRELLPHLLNGTSSLAVQLRILLARRSQSGDPLARMRPLLDEIDALLLAEIAEHRRDEAAAAEREDILSMLIGARFEDGSAMSDGELRDQLVTLLLAGHETTATGLAWTLDLLLRHPRALGRLREELADGGEEYLRAVIWESLRLRPVVPLAGRRLASELRAGDLVLPAGSDATPAIWLTHTRADLYPEPYAFRPERFAGRKPGTYEWIPFGGGVRRCLGAAFAELEMRVVLKAIVSRRALAHATGRAERAVRRNVTLSPRGGTRVLATGAGGPAVRAAGGPPGREATPIP